MQSKVEWNQGSGHARCVRYSIYLIQAFNYFTSRTCDEEGLPLLKSLISTRDDKYRHDGKGYTPFSLCFHPNRHDKKRLPCPHFVSIHIDASCVYVHTDTMRRGIPPSRRVSIQTDATRRGFPALVVFLSACDEEGLPLLKSLISTSTDTMERGIPPSRCVSIQTDATRRGFPALIVFPST
jgi:hypothetical protein